MDDVPPPPPEPSAGQGEPSAAELMSRLMELTQRANHGDRVALLELRRMLDRHSEVVSHVGDLAKLAEHLWIEAVAEKDVLRTETAKREVARLKAELCGEHPTPMEKLLVDHIAVCHLAAQAAELSAAQSSALSGSQLKRLESAQRRFLTSIKTLATLRTLLNRGLAPLSSVKLFRPQTA